MVRPLAEAPAATPSPAASAVASTGAKAKGSFADFDTRGDLCLGSREDIGPEATRSSVRIAKTLDVLRNEINALAPKRSKGYGRLDRGCRPPVACIRSQSLGAGGGHGHRHRARHHARSSASAATRRCVLAEKLRASKDPRIKYIIWNRRIANYAAIGGTPAWEWRSYAGSNPQATSISTAVQSDKGELRSDRAVAWCRGE